MTRMNRIKATVRMQWPGLFLSKQHYNMVWISEKSGKQMNVIFFCQDCQLCLLTLILIWNKQNNDMPPEDAAKLRLRLLFLNQVILWIASETSTCLGLQSFFTPSASMLPVTVHKRSAHGHSFMWNHHNAFLYIFWTYCFVFSFFCNHGANLRGRDLDIAVFSAWPWNFMSIFE